MVTCVKDIFNKPVKAGDLVVYCEHTKPRGRGMRLCSNKILKVTKLGITVEKDNRQGFYFVKNFAKIEENDIDRR